MAYTKFHDPWNSGTCCGTPSPGPDTPLTVAAANHWEQGIFDAAADADQALLDAAAAQSDADQALLDAAAAQTSANNAQSTANANTASITAINNRIGNPQGLALVAGKWYTPYEFTTTFTGIENGLVGNDFTAGRTCTITSIGFQIQGTAGSAGAVTRVGIYSFNPATYDGVLVADFGTVDSTTLGMKVANGSANVTQGQVYLLVMVTQGGAATKPIYSGTNFVHPWIAGSVSTLAAYKGYFASGVAGALPANLNIPANSAATLSILNCSAAA